MGREFKLGEMVLLHTPCLSGKLDSIWEGPYEVEKVISATSYNLSVPDKRSHTIVVHINRLKPWKTPTANLFRVVVAEESEGTSEPVGKGVCIVRISKDGAAEALGWVRGSCHNRLG